MAELDLGRVVGSQIHNVTGAPGADLGLVNDWAMDVHSGAVYEKTAAGWAERGSFKGPKGDAGVDGKTPVLSINAAGHLIATYAD